MLWVDKYRPVKFDDLSYHNATITQRLIALTNRPMTLPHLLIYGPTGCGKKTRIRTIVRQLYGPSAVTKLKLEKRTFITPSNRSIDINMISSPYHIELSPSDAGFNDRYIIQDIIKEMAATKNISSTLGGGSVATNNNTNDITTTTGTTTSTSKPQYKIVVLHDVDLLSKQAQAALRRTMEQYTTTCRLILCCTSSAKVMDAVRSRCLPIRIPSPSYDDICIVVKKIATKEAITVSEEVLINIARESNRNIRRAILMFEATVVQHRGSSSNNSNSNTALVASTTTVPKTDWEIYIIQLATDITKEQSPQRLVAAREKMYELLVNCIPPTVLLKTLVRELLVNLDDTIKMDILYWAAFYEHRIAMGSKEIFHLEAFVAKYMSIYKKYLNDIFG